MFFSIALILASFLGPLTRALSSTLNTLWCLFNFSTGELNVSSFFLITRAVCFFFILIFYSLFVCREVFVLMFLFHRLRVIVRNCVRAAFSTQIDL